MPKLLIIKKHVFLVYSSDLSESRKHIHIESRKGRRRKTAKFWLEPEIKLVDSGNFNDKEINYLRKLIIDNEEILKRQIDNFITGKRIRTIRL